MPEWANRRLGDVIRLKRGFDLRTSDRQPGPYPVMGSAGISGWHDEGPIAGPAVVLGRAGASMGTASYCDVDRFWPLNTALFVEDFLGNNPRFVFHLLQVTDLTGFNSGSVQPMLNRNYIRNVLVRIPGRAQQDAVAEVLAALDNKIAVNDQVVAKTRELGICQVLESISRGSEHATLGSLTVLVSRGIAPKYSDDDSELLVLNQKCIRNGQVSLDSARRTIAHGVPSQKLLEMNDVLVNSTGVGTLGRVARWTASEPCTADSHVTIVRFDETRIDPVVAGFAMLRAQPQIEALGEGSTGQTELNRYQLCGLDLALPPAEETVRLRPILDSLEMRADSALRECESLASLRDTLLPRLMSGEIRVRDVEKIVEDAT